MKKLLILFLPVILFAQRPEGFRGTNGISMVDIRIAIGDSNIVSLQGTTPDTAKIQGGYPLKLSGLRVTGNAKFESNVVMSTIAGEQIKAGAGTAALPQYSASADTNTGMYLDGADGLGLSTAGVQRLGISSTGMTTYSQTAIGATADTLKSIKLVNTTQASAGAQQVSPSLMFSSYGWKTDATASPVWTHWMVYNLPVQGTSAPTSNIVFASKIGSAAWTTPATLTSAGYLTVTRLYLTSSAYQVNSDGLTYNSSGGINIKSSHASGPVIFSPGNAEAARFTSDGKFGKGTTTPLNSFSLVDAASGQGTGIHVVSSQWNKSRTTWAAAHDTSSIMQYIDSAGGPRVSLKSAIGDSVLLYSGTTFASMISNQTINLSSGGGPLYWNGNTLYTNADDSKSIGSTSVRFQSLNVSDNARIGGKSQTATMYISGENTIAGQDSSLVLSALNGIPTISAMHTGTFTNGGRRFYTGADTLLLVNGAKTGRDSTYFIRPNGSFSSTGESQIGTSTDNSFITIGLNIDQQGNDDAALSIKSTDVSHPMTALAEASTYCNLKKANADYGGARWEGYNDTANYQALYFGGFGTAGNYVTNPIMDFAVAESNGASIAPASSTDLCVKFRSSTTPFLSMWGSGMQEHHYKIGIRDSLYLHQEKSVIADDGTILLASSVCGWGEVMVGDNQELLRFKFASDGTVTLLSDCSTNTDDADTDGDLCAYDGGDHVVIKNRLGASKKIAVDVKYYTP